jgi:NAD-dependent dihydropyrimidine dehydrogenase PreA subunit
MGWHLPLESRSSLEEEGVMTKRVVGFVAGLLAAAVAGVWLFGERGRLLLPSTREALRVGGWRGILNGSALHGYVYARWSNQYLRLLIHTILPRLSPEGKQRLADRYHAKVLTPDQAEAIVTLDQPIPLQDLEQIVPYPVARDLVLAGPPDVAVYECGCRHSRDNGCKPTQVCMVVGQPIVDFVLEHNPQSARRLTQAEALQLLREEHERGHLHSAWFKDAILDRFYVLCNCCSCCCLGITGMMQHGMRFMAPSGYVAQVDEELCAACAACEEACPFDAIQVDGRAVVRWEDCMGCGVCVGQCPNGAISLVRDEGKGLPLDVRLLAQQAVSQGG